ncbi:MAG: hypothetical protein JXA52_08915 [Planctomycetes bacterium]|nr:hypothetical protein [Planctomycetota bacterium]
MLRALISSCLLTGLLACGCGSSDLALPIPGFRGEGHLPENGVLEGWNRSGKFQRYGASSLHEYIGNQAKMIRSYGFNNLCACDYSRANDKYPTLSIESYEMDKPLAASGIYHYHRGRLLREMGTPVDVGVEGVIFNERLYFYQGRYFFKIIYTGKPETMPDLVAIAQKVAAEIPGTAEPPRGFQYLAVEGVDPKSGRVTAGYTFNYAFLPPAIFAKAPGAGKIAEVFLISHGEEDYAKKTGQDYRYFLQDSGLEYAFKRTSDRRLVWWARDTVQGRVVVTRYKTWIIGVLTPETYEMGEIIIDRVIERIRTR